jgi:hypothetical protein
MSTPSEEIREMTSPVTASCSGRPSSDAVNQLPLT